MLFRNGTHAIDLVTFFAESEPQWVVAVLDAAFDGYGPRYAGDGGRDPATDPGLLGLIGFANGVRAVYQGSQATLGYSMIELIGDRGRIHLGLSHDTMQILLPGPGGMYDVVSRDFPRTHPTQAALLAVVAEMVALVEHGGQSVSPPREARQTLAIMLGFLQSHAEGGVRVALPVEDR